MNTRAGQIAQAQDLINVDDLLSAYYDIEPNADNPAERVSFGTSGHRGTSLNASFNQAHIIAITQAIVEYRKANGISGPLFIGRDTHALSEPALVSALQVLLHNGVDARMDSCSAFTPTPVISHAILCHNGANSDQGLRLSGENVADGIIITPSHNPPQDGGFKYNPPHGGPADSNVTSAIAERANQILKQGYKQIAKLEQNQILSHPNLHNVDLMHAYIDDLADVIDFDVIAEKGVKISVNPLGGAAVEYWSEIAKRYGIDLTVLNPQIDPTWSFMPLDWDGKIRMDCSSPYSMSVLVKDMSSGNFDIGVGNDADADRHGIVTVDGLMNPNHYLAVAIDYLSKYRPQWNLEAKVGKTLVSSSLINKVCQANEREVFEVPVGFKYFTDGLINSSLIFGGEESAGACFLRKNGKVWCTDKDGIIMGLLAAEIVAVTGYTPSQLHTQHNERFGQAYYARIDQPIDLQGKQKLLNLSEQDVDATTIAGEEITAVLVRASGDNCPIGGLKVETENAWFALRPSGTENVYKIYAESFISAEHLALVQQEAKLLVDKILS